MSEERVQEIREVFKNIDKTREILQETWVEIETQKSEINRLTTQINKALDTLEIILSDDVVLKSAIDILKGE